MQLYKEFHHIVPGATRSINPIEQKLILHTKRNSLCTVVAYTNVFDRKNAITFFYVLYSPFRPYDFGWNKNKLELGHDP